KVIGHGAFSTVRSALRNTDNIKVAIKSISKFDALRSKSKQHMDEWEIMKLLQNNPYVLTLFDVFETETEIHLVTEYCMGGELFDAIKRKGTTKRSSFRRGRFTEPQAARITNQILKALVELHALGIVHRDIKAENILLLNGDESDIQVKLCDFGMARLLFGTNAPPEGCHGNCIGPATDMFSMGVTLYILLCGFSPVFCEDVVEFPDAYWNDISEEAKDVVRSMLHHNPQERISAVDALKNAWI
ncbi:kinase-like protein, partial [Fragilariopsis cylindrus CCMP1102]